MKIRQSTQRYGIALFIVMLTVVVLAIIMGAFFSAYKSHFSLTRSSNASQAASAACDSVYQYVVYRAEHDKTWGADKFEDLKEGDPMGSVLDFTQEPGTHNFVGKVESLDATFHGTVHNNLSGAASTEVAAVAQAGTIVCSVTAKSGDSSRSAKFILRVAPLFDSSVLSRSDLRVNADKLTMRSLDPNRNMLRAEGDIYVPDILTGKDTQFLLPEPLINEADKKGMLWSKQDIHSFHAGGGGSFETLDTGEEFAEAARNSNGKLVADGTSHFPIFDINLRQSGANAPINLAEINEKLVLPAGNKEVGVTEGRWNFVRKHADVHFTADYTRPGWSGPEKADVPDFQKRVWVDVLEYYKPGEDTPSKVYRAAHRNDDLQKQIPEEVKSWWGKDFDLDPNSILTKSVDIEGYEGDVELLENNVLAFPSQDGTAQVTFDLLNQSVRASSNATVTINGPFELTSETIEGAETHEVPIAATPPPRLILDHGGAAKAAFVAKETFRIENGITEGLGALVSLNGDVVVQPKDTASVNVNTNDKGSGLLVYAGGNVVLRNPDETKKWNFKGLVYARNGVKMEGHGQDSTFEGTIVALQALDPEGTEGLKGIEFFECGEIEFVYDDKLLDAFVRSMPGDRIQLESVYWTR